MNKKILTLLAAGFMGSLSVSAFAAVTDGKLHQLTTADGKYLSITRTYNNTADSLIMVNSVGDPMGNLYKKSLWKIVEGDADNTTEKVYTLTNYATGKVLSLDLSKTDGTIRAGQSAWKITDGKLNAVKSGQTYAIVVEDGEVKVAQTNAAVSAGQAFSYDTPNESIELTAAQVNGLYGSASVLNFEQSLQGNPLDGVPFQAVNEDDDHYANVLLSTGEYLVVDTAKWANSVNNNKYWKLTSGAKSETPADPDAVASGVTSTLLDNGRTAGVYQFKFTLNVADSYVVTITPKAVPVEQGAATAKGKQFRFGEVETERPLIYGQFAGGANVLTATADEDEMNPATATFGTVTPPASLSNKYVYYVQDYNKYVHNEDGTVTGTKNTANYKKYFVLDCAEAKDHAASTVAIPSNMWYLDGTSLKNMINTEEVAATGAIILVNEAEGLYKFNNDTVKLTQGPKIEAAQAMAYKTVTKADETNGALSFRLVSKLADGLYVTANEDGLLAVTNGELADALKLKVKAVDDEAIVDNSNDVAKPVYTISNRLGNLWVAYNNAGNFEFTEEEEDAVEVSFWATGDEDQYKIVFTDDDDEPKAITANASSGLLYATDMCDETVNNIFEFAKKDAPKYGAPAYGHVQITTLEDDYKMIAPQLDGFASLKREGQILKSDVYTNDTLKLWLDTALVDDVKPLYYVSSSAFNAEGDLRKYFFNPANVAKANNDAKKLYSFEDRVEGAYRAAFTPASQDEHKCLVLGKDTISTIQLNPAAIAFEVAAEISDEAYYIVSDLKSKNDDFVAAEEVSEDNLPYIADDEAWYLAQLNNVLFWTQDGTKAEVFVINRTKAPTANEAIEAESGVEVIAGQGVVTVQGAAGKVITVSNILGQTIANQVAASDNVTIAAPAGVVVVTVDGEVVKTVVK